jgi:Phage capsid family
MCADWRGPWGDDPEGEGSPGDPRPFGTRPFGTRPFGTRPFGTRPFGTRPFGTRPFGTRPFGTRPFGTRPFGTRPFGTRPFGTREEEGDGTLDPAEWTADIAELFCSCSAVVRLGAHVVYDDREVPVPAVEVPEAAPPFGYLEQPETTKPLEHAEGQRKESAEKPEARVSQRLLRPRDHELALKVILPNHLVRDLVGYPELAWAMKEDIAHRLVNRADWAFLHGTKANHEPVGIASTQGVGTQALPGGAGPDLLATARAMIDQVRRARTQFRAAGWVLDPDALAELTDHTTGDFQTRGPGVALDSQGELLSYDGADGGTFLGYPFIVSGAAGQTNDMVFSADWGEAWIGVDRDLVTVDISTDVNFQTDETVVRSVMHHDFVVRTAGAFIHTTLAA